MGLLICWYLIKVRCFGVAKAIKRKIPNEYKVKYNRLNDEFKELLDKERIHPSNRLKRLL